MLDPTRPNVLLDPPHWVRDEDRARLAGVVELVDCVGPAPLDDAEFLRQAAECVGLIKLGGRMPDLTADLLKALPHLRIVGLRSDRFGTGIDIEAATELGITVVDADNYASAHPVAEWVLGLMLICLKNGGALYRQMIAGTETWARAHNDSFVSGELTERRVGLVGCGHVGQRLVELLAPFRADLLVCDPYLPQETAQRLGIRRADLDTVLTHAEILVVQTPLTPRTTGLIGTRELALLPPGRILINCSRGKVLDQAALIERLQRGDLIAGLDVFDPEPLPHPHPLRELPNVFLTPHTAWYAPNAFHRYFQLTALEFERYFSGQPLQFQLQPRMLDIRHGRL